VNGPAPPVRETAVSAPGRGGPATADRVHQPGEYVASTRGRPPARNGSPRLAGRQSVSPGTPGHGRASGNDRGGGSRFGWEAGDGVDHRDPIGNTSRFRPRTTRELMG